MTKKLPLLLALLLMLALPAAFAESAAPYTPGDVTEEIFLDAFNRGEMVMMDMAFGLKLNDTFSEIYGEDAILAAAIAEALQNLQLTVGAGKIENGLRVTLAGDYTVDAQTADLDIALDLTKDGVALTGSFLPDERVTARWETILALCGASEEDISAIMSLRDTDFEALLAELVAQLQPVAQMAAQIAAPYGETILAHIAALPMVINENVPAEGGYPAAANEIQIQVTAKALGDLLVALSEQLKQDATLCALIDALLAEASEPDSVMTTAALCDAVIEVAQEDLTDETMPLNLFIGMDAAGNPLYVSAVVQDEDGMYYTFNYIAGQMEDNGASLLSLDVLTLSSEQEILDGVSFALAYDIDDADSSIMSTELLLGCYEDGEELFSIVLNMHNDAADFEGVSGYAGAVNTAFTVDETFSTFSTNMDADFSSFPTDDGGETISLSGKALISDAGESGEMTFDVALQTNAADRTCLMGDIVSLPKAGIDEWSEAYMLRVEAPATVSGAAETALETATSEDLEALGARAMQSLEMTLTILSEILPPDLIAALQAS